MLLKLIISSLCLEPHKFAHGELDINIFIFPQNNYVLKKGMGKSQEKKKFYRAENKYDPYLLKDAIQQFITDEVKETYNVKELFRFQNFKCVFGLFIVANVVFSHYHLVPWPQDYFILMACVILYYATTRIYTWYEAKVEEDLFVLFQDENSTKQMAFGVVTNLFSRFAIVRLVEHPSKRELSKRQIDVQNYFDEQGYISISNGKRLVKEMMSEGRKKLE